MYPMKLPEKTLWIPMGENKLSTIDQRSLYLLLMLRSQKTADIIIRHPRYSYCPVLPLYYEGAKKDENYEVIKVTIRKMVLYDIDYKFDDREKSRIHAFNIMIKTHLQTAVFITMWGYDENADIAARIYCQSYFPILRFFYARRLRKEMKQRVEDLCAIRQFDVYANEVYETARVTLGNISRIMRSKTTLLGSDRDSSLDLNLCSTLAPILYIKFPNNRIKDIVQQCEGGKIADYVGSFMSHLGEYVKEPTHPLMESDCAPPLMIGVAVCTVAGAMYMFAHTIGLIRF